MLLFPCMACALVLGLTGCHRVSEAGDNAGKDAEQTHAAWLTECADEAGVAFVYSSGADGRLLLPEIMGGGAAVFDADGDGRVDLYLVDGAGPNRLHRQVAPGRFEDVTGRSGLGDTGFGMGVAAGDIDNDGDIDVYVTNYGPDALYRNRGDGTFEPVEGIDVPGWSCSAAFVDYDADGYLDLFVTQYVDFDPQRRCFNKASQPDYCGPKVFEPLPDVLLHNNRDGTFTDASTGAGIGGVAAAGLGVVAFDANDDGRIDLYVANDAYANHLWLNEGDGTFTEAAVLYGVAFNLHGQPEAGMGVIAEDLDGDTGQDLFITHLTRETNTLYRRVGADRGFVDVTGQTGLGTSSLAYTGFGIGAIDFESDGDLDLLVANGRVNRLDPLPGAVPAAPWDMLAEANLAYLNDGAGHFTVDDMPHFSGPIEISRGLALGDLDADGDEDVVLINIEGPARIYRNAAPRTGHSLGIRVVDPRLRRDALGAAVTVVTDGTFRVRTLITSSGYLSSSEPMLRFGLGGAERVDEIRVRWPDGLEEIFEGTDELDRTIVLVRGSALPAPDTSTMMPPVRDALVLARQQVLLEPHSPVTWGRYGALLDAHELYAGAATCYARAAALDPAAFQWPYLHAVVLELLGGDADTIIALHERAAARRPDFATPHLRCGRLYLARGALDDAAAAFERALEIDPKLTAAWCGLGQARLSQGDPQGAIAPLQQATRLAGADRAAWSLLAQAFMQSGDTAAARTALTAARTAPAARAVPDPVHDAVRKMGMSPQHLLDRTPELFERGDWQGAIDNLSAVAEADPTHAKVRMQLGLAHARAGNAREAIRCLEQALALDGTLLRARTELASVYMNEGHFDRAIPHLERAHELAPDDAAILQWLGTAHGLARQYEPAARAFRRAIELVPEDAGCHYNLATVLLNGGDPRAAVPHFREVLRLQPDHAEAARNLQLALARLERPDAANR